MFPKLLNAALCGLAVLALGGAGLAAGPSRPDVSPRDFLKKAIEGDNSEIALGRIAQRRAASPDVKAFGRQLADDHKRSQAQAADLARVLGVAAPTEPSPEAQAEQRKLKLLSGRAFDREFIRYMIEDHKQEIRDFRLQAARRQGRVSRLAQMAVPTLRKHLRMAQSLKARADGSPNGTPPARQPEPARGEAVGEQPPASDAPQKDASPYS